MSWLQATSRRSRPAAVPVRESAQETCAWSNSSLEGLTATAVIQESGFSVQAGMVTATLVEIGRRANEARARWSSTWCCFITVCRPSGIIFASAGWTARRPVGRPGTRGRCGRRSERQPCPYRQRHRSRRFRLPHPPRRRALWPACGMVVGGGVHISVVSVAPYMKWAVYTCSRSITGAVAGFVASIALADASRPCFSPICGWRRRWRRCGRGLDVGSSHPDACGCAVKNTLRRIADVGALSLRVSIPLRTTCWPLGLCALEQISPLTLRSFLAPALAAQRLFGMYQDQLRGAEDLASRKRAA